MAGVASPGADIALDLLAGWAAARSLSRALPPPVIDGDAVRVDTGSPAEERRYLFAAPSPAITALAATIRRPRILLKLCAPLADLLALLPPGWRGHPQSFLMTCDGPMHPATTPLVGYTLAVVADGPVLVARVTAADGRLAASGRAVGHAGLFVYDQIVTDPGHRRRGLAGHVMRALEAAGHGGARQVLTATAAGHGLYTALGWSTLSLYSTAEYGDAPEPGGG